MPAWQVVLLLNLCLGVGLGLGYAAWGHRLDALDREVKTAQAQIERLERERQACAAGARAGEQRWEGRGIVRAAYPQMILITHEDIGGLLPARTTGFRIAFPPNGGPAQPLVAPGSAVRFWLHGTRADDAVLVAIAAWE